MMTIKIYWQKQCEDLVNDVLTNLPALFPGIIFHKTAESEIPDEAYDPSRFQYDAASLLRILPKEEFSLWIVREDLYYPGFRYLYGAALPGRAVVSAFRPDTREGFLKETAHELGHALGLNHCKKKCIMHPSRSETELESKSRDFCPACRMQLIRKIKGNDSARCRNHHKAY